MGEVDPYGKKLQEQADELTRLREENEKLRDYQTEKYDEVVDQRDTLLEALREILQTDRNGYDAGYKMHAIAHAAIAEVEGEQA